MIDNNRSVVDIIADCLHDSEMQFFTVMIGEAEARELLAHNVEPVTGKDGSNRKASAVRVARYLDIMRSGDWLLSPQPLSFSAPDAKGKEDLVDGQHRLKALLALTKEFPEMKLPFTVAINCPSDTKWVIDTGNPKTGVDFLRMEGEAYASMLGPALKMLYAYNEVPFKTIPLWRSVRLTPQQQRMYRDKHVGLRGGLRVAVELKTLAMPYVVTVVYYLITQEHGPEKALEFLTGLEKGLVPGATTEGAVWKLREYLGAQKRMQYRWDGYEQLGLLILAANDWLLNSSRFVPSAAHKALRLTTPSATRKFPRVLTRAELPEMPTLL